jgi:secreted trypsin-like serine protease
VKFQKKKSFWRKLNVGECTVYSQIKKIEIEEENKKSRFFHPTFNLQKLIVVYNDPYIFSISGSKSTSDNLQTVALPVVPLARCRQRYEKFGIPLRETQMCAGVQGRDTCKGDSGAPLMLFNPQRASFEVVGVTSIGSTACGSGLPGVYTKVDSYIDWIHEVVDSTT